MNRHDRVETSAAEKFRSELCFLELPEEAPRAGSPRAHCPPQVLELLGVQDKSSSVTL
jgi:hypothetical protein